MEIPLEELGQAFSAVERALKFAPVVALTRVAVSARNASREKLQKTFITRNRWSILSISHTGATPEKQESTVFLKDQYLADQEEGLTRPGKEGGQPIPSMIREAAGIAQTRVISRALRASSIVGKKKAKLKGIPFEDTVGGTKGIWVRAAKKVKLLYVLQEGPKKIKKRPFFRKTVEKAYRKNIGPEYEKARKEQLKRVAGRYLS